MQAALPHKRGTDYPYSMYPANYAGELDAMTTRHVAELHELLIANTGGFQCGKINC